MNLPLPRHCLHTGPLTFQSLSTWERRALCALRHCAHRHGQEGASTELHAADELLRLVAAHHCRPVRLHAPLDSRVAADERLLLSILRRARLGQAGALTRLLEGLLRPSAIATARTRLLALPALYPWPPAAD